MQRYEIYNVVERKQHKTIKATKIAFTDKIDVLQIHKHIHILLQNTENKAILMVFA